MFTKSLQPLSSITATALSTTSNILSSGAASWALFSERLEPRWLLGALLLISGTACLTAASQRATADADTSNALKEGHEKQN